MIVAPAPAASRLDRENRTIRAMVGIFCRGRHGRRDRLCAECAELLAYAEARTARCPWLPAKPACRVCTIHCYRRDMRERIREVMAWSGPRMALRHPWLSLRHALDGRAGPPPDPPGRRNR